MVTADIIQKYREGLERVHKNLSDSNIMGCMNNSTDLTRTSDFLDFAEGVFLGETLEGIFDNFTDIIRLFQVKKEEVNLIKENLSTLLVYLEKNFPPKDDKAKVELYNMLVGARCSITKLQICLMREQEIQRPPPFQQPIEQTLHSPIEPTS